jgi:2-deoxy-D-gluconate 3-dehydrogenase
MTKMFDLTGKVAIVTGGNGGIGLGMARGLASHGASIVVAGRDAEKTAAAVKELRALGAPAASGVTVDVKDEASVNAMVAETIGRHGRLDVLVNNAGINIRKPPHELSLAEWREILETNLTSAFLASHAVYPHMKNGGGGKIVNIGSMMSIFGAPFAPAYAASKGGIVQFSRVCASAWAKDNIQVNAVLPGWIDTELTRRGRAEIRGLNERVLERTPASRWGVPDDLAGIAVFLCSAASDFVTGAAIPVDGGYSISG